MEYDELPIIKAIRERDAALIQVEEHAATAWKNAALEAVIKAAATLGFFIVDDVYQWIPDDIKTHDLRAMGPVMLQAKELGYIEPTGTFKPSYLPGRHAGPRRVWKSFLGIMVTIPPNMLEVGRTIQITNRKEGYNGI